MTSTRTRGSNGDIEIGNPGSRFARRNLGWISAGAGRKDGKGVAESLAEDGGPIDSDPLLAATLVHAHTRARRVERAYS